jgi:hypothetical protein
MQIIQQKDSKLCFTTAKQARTCLSTVRTNAVASEGTVVVHASRSSQLTLTPKIQNDSQKKNMIVMFS